MNQKTVKQIQQMETEIRILRHWLATATVEYEECQACKDEKEIHKIRWLECDHHYMYIRTLNEMEEMIHERTRAIRMLSKPKPPAAHKVETAFDVEDSRALAWYLGYDHIPEATPPNAELKYMEVI